MTDAETPDAPETDAVAEALPAGDAEILPVLPVRATVLFPVPEVMTPLLVARPGSVAAIESALAGNRRMIVLAQQDPEKEDVTADDLYTVGTLANLDRMLKLPDGTTSVLVEGLRRVMVDEILQEQPFIVGRGRPLSDFEDTSKEAKDLAADVLQLFQRVVDLSDAIAHDVYVRAMNAENPGVLADTVANGLPVPFVRIQELLEIEQTVVRLGRLHSLLSDEIEILERQHSLEEEIDGQIESAQHDFILREQMQAITEELGDSDAATRDIQEFQEVLEARRYPEYVQERIERELGRLNSMPMGSPEINVIRNYVEWLLEVPWYKRTRDRLSIKDAEVVLGESHFGLEKAKDRILEYLAVRKLARRMRSPILCFVGPPGVGKTSLGKAIAEAMGRRFERISLGGVRDEAEIRGHRRTYIGSLPGRIIQTMRRTGTVNPVFMLDEIDKLGLDFRGDPTTALLEVLDPEQNHAFSDHYIEIPFNLSRTLFIATANTLTNLPAALVDRMEVIEIAGYTDDEKLEIARRFLMPEQNEQHGLESEHVTLTEGAYRAVVRSYTREAGVRELERQLANICRRAAYLKVEGKAKSLHVTAGNLHKYLGQKRYRHGEIAEEDQVATATGAFWTRYGGELMPVEVSMVDGSGRLTLTGRLGDVMKESARTARTYCRADAERLGIGSTNFDGLDFHVHIPGGAVPKEGATAGITVATAMVSAITGRPVRRDTAMSGEITLQGRVLRTRGVKEKVLAAHRAGIRRFVLPAGNERDLHDVPDSARRGLEFTFAAHMSEVVDSALVTGGAAV
ncbi:MAG: endopeptidase La [Chloroflexota bacterium]|nr:endopeptidase La [Chloroflexota bacterium]